MKNNEYLRVKNFEKYQHYKERRPPWIKLYFALLSDPDFALMTAASKLHTIAIMLLASQHDNKIPYHEQWISKAICANERLNWQEILSSGFVICYQDASKPLADCKQDAIIDKKYRYTDIQNTDIQSVLAHDACELKKSVNGKCQGCLEAFEKFWAIYPRHSPPRTEALKKWCAQYQAGLDIQKLLDWIGKAKALWQEPKFIPMATTFLNQRRWEGDLPPPPSQKDDPWAKYEQENEDGK